MGGPGDPQNLQQLALGGCPPSSVSSCWQGVREISHFRSLSKTNKQKKLGKKKTQLVQNGFQKLGHKSESKAQGQKLGDLGIPRGVGNVWL